MRNLTAPVLSLKDPICLGTFVKQGQDVGCLQHRKSSRRESLHATGLSYRLLRLPKSIFSSLSLALNLTAVILLVEVISLQNILVHQHTRPPSPRCSPICPFCPFSSLLSSLLQIWSCGSRSSFSWTDDCREIFSSSSSESLDSWLTSSGLDLRCLTCEYFADVDCFPGWAGDLFHPIPPV